MTGLDSVFAIAALISILLFFIPYFRGKFKLNKWWMFGVITPTCLAATFLLGTGIYRLF